MESSLSEALEGLLAAQQVGDEVYEIALNGPAGGYVFVLTKHHISEHGGNHLPIYSTPVLKEMIDHVEQQLQLNSRGWKRVPPLHQPPG